MENLVETYRIAQILTLLGISPNLLSLSKGLKLEDLSNL